MAEAIEGPVRLDYPEDGLARITLNEGERLNTLTFEMIEALHEMLKRLQKSPPRAVILTGTGRAFCGGAHVTYFTEADSPLAGNAGAIRDHYVRPILAAYDAVTALPCPTIAAINASP